MRLPLLAAGQAARAPVRAGRSRSCAISAPARRRGSPQQAAITRISVSAVTVTTRVVMISLVFTGIHLPSRPGLAEIGHRQPQGCICLPDHLAGEPPLVVV